MLIVPIVYAIVFIVLSSIAIYTFIKELLQNDLANRDVVSALIFFYLFVVFPAILLWPFSLFLFISICILYGFCELMFRFFEYLETCKLA